jgi:hypothetical protein
MRRPSIPALALATALFAAAPVATATTAAAAERSLQGCQVQVNYPHQSNHNPDRWNVEFRVYGCAVAKTASVSRWVRVAVSYPGGGGIGGGDFAWKYQATLSVPAGSSRSTFYSETCTAGARYTVTVKGLFTIDGRSEELSQANSFNCV